MAGALKLNICRYRLTVSPPRVDERSSPRVEAGTSGFMFVIYWIISENKEKSYIGFSGNIDARMKMHREHKVSSTKNFGNFNYTILEKVPSLEYARIQEKYWKSATGRRKLKRMFQ